MSSVRVVRAALVGALTCLALLAGAVGCSSGGGGDSKSTASPSSATADLQAGLRAHARGQYDQAIADYNAVLKQDPKNKFALYNLGAIAQLQGRAGEAKTDYNKVLAIDP